MYQLVIRGDALKSSAVVAYADVPKLILDDRQLLAVARREDVVQERRLAAPKKASEDRHGHARVGAHVLGGSGGQYPRHRKARGKSFANFEPPSLTDQH